jgi:phosphoribosyl 1,2-cyclic phosphodiesterase
MIDITVLASSSRGNCYLVEGEGCKPLLLDCGMSLSWTRKELRFRCSKQITDLAACLISHEHGDHSKAANDLMGAAVDIYTSRGTADALGLKGHRLQIIRSREQISIDGWKVLPFEAVHDCAEPLGFLIAGAGGKVVYATDTAYLPVRFNGLNIIMVECNYALDILEANEELHPAIKKRVIGNHFGLDQVKKFLQANDLTTVQAIHLLHLSSTNADAERFKREVQELTGKPVYIAER